MHIRLYISEVNEKEICNSAKIWWKSHMTFQYLLLSYFLHLFNFYSQTWNMIYIQLREGILALCAQILWNWSTKIREKKYTWWIMDTCISYLWIRKGCSYSFSLIQVGDRWAIVTWDGRLYILAIMTFHFILKSHFDFFSYYPIQIPPPI